MSPVRHCEFPTTVFSVDSELDQDPLFVFSQDSTFYFWING